ncbi:MAG: nucleotidyl transferase AbiEii/AbiGii toxin family protein [Deltaproteobacteria bacterium]|nr:nucleotidyl transferase AbiEii/AbiGii toxin family protein [Deltaproteobacteria bacterium]
MLLRVLPFVNEEEIFALKGGTAINFFLRDLPRLSVDIDLTYLPVNDRETALNDIDKALLRISEKVEKKIAGVRVFPKKDHGLNILAGLLIRRGDAAVKIEPNPVLRGSVFPTETRTLCQRAQDFFELSIEAPHPFIRGSLRREGLCSSGPAASERSFRHRYVVQE